jgi:hypothetical protein
MKLFKNFLKIWTICTICSAIPFLMHGLLFGAPSVLLASVIITLFFQNELGEPNR